MCYSTACSGPRSVRLSVRPKGASVIMYSSLCCSWTRLFNSSLCYPRTICCTAAFATLGCTLLSLFAVQHSLLPQYVSVQQGKVPGREYWMIYRGTGFLTVLGFGSSPSPPPLSWLLSLPVCRRWSLQTEEGGGGGARSSYNVEKAWSSINHSILFGADANFWVMADTSLGFWYPESGCKMYVSNAR